MRDGGGMMRGSGTDIKYGRAGDARGQDRWLTQGAERNARRPETDGSGVDFLAGDRK